MKSFCAILAILVLSSIFLFAQTKDEQAIQQVLNEVATALKAKDLATLNRIWADDYIFVSPAGTVANKVQRAAAITAGTPDEFFAYEDVKTRIYGNTAVINTMVKSKNASQVNATTIPSTLVMVKNSGRWQIVNGQGTMAAVNTPGTNDEQAIKQIKQIEQELLDALLKGDASANERYQADNYVFTAPDGTVMNKAKGIADIKSGDLKFESSKMDDIKVQVHGHTAVVTCRTTDKGKYKDIDLSGQYRWTDTFAKTNGRWLLVAGHGTKIMQQ